MHSLAGRQPGLARAVVVAALALGAAVALVLAAWPSSPARAQSPAEWPAEEQPARTGMFAVAGQISPNTYGLYLVDPQRGGLAVYEYVPAERRLHLRAARAFSYDLQLESYNTEPSPGEVADMVNQARRLSETTTAPR